MAVVRSVRPVPFLASGARRTESTVQRRTYTVTEAAQILGISRSSAYLAVRRGEIASVRIGGRVVVSRATIDELLGAPGTAEGDAPSAT